MRGSSTTPGRTGARDNAPVHVAFRVSAHVGIRDDLVFAAQWLAYALPCRHSADSHGCQCTAWGPRGSLLPHSQWTCTTYSLPVLTDAPHTSRYTRKYTVVYFPRTNKRRGDA
jgi:hypothetical protein